MTCGFPMGQMLGASSWQAFSCQPYPTLGHSWLASSIADQTTDMHGSTNLNLMLAVQRHPSSDTNWQQLAVHYVPQIAAWCRAFGLQDNDCQDVTQEVLLNLYKSIRSFEYDPSLNFRAWLKTVTKHALYAWSKKNKPRGVSGSSSVLQVLLSKVAQEDLSERLQQEFDLEMRELAFIRVRMKVSAKKWKAFELTAINGKNGSEAAIELGMKVAHVYVAKSEVLKEIQHEIRRLEQTESPERVA